MHWHLHATRFAGCCWLSAVCYVLLSICTIFWHKFRFYFYGTTAAQTLVLLHLLLLLLLLLLLVLLLLNLE